MKAYKITLLVVDHDKMGAKAIGDVFENVRYPNHCIMPTVVASEEADIGEWTDAHPLNQTATMRDEIARLFGPADVVGRLRQMTPDQRLEVFSEFCTHCGGDEPRCSCSNDE